MTAEMPTLANVRAKFDPSAPAPIIPILIPHSSGQLIRLTPARPPLARDQGGEVLQRCDRPLTDLIEATVDDKRLSGDERRVVARQECHGAGYVLRLCHSFDRLERPYSSARLFRQRYGHGTFR